MRSNDNNKNSINNRYSSGRQKQKDIRQSKTSSKCPSKKPRRLSSAGCTPPPPSLHPSSSDDQDEPAPDDSQRSSRQSEPPAIDRRSRDGRLHRHHDDVDEGRSPIQFVGTATIRRNFSPSTFSTDRSSHYPFRVMGGLGIAQIFLGLLSVSMQLVALFVSEPTSFIGAGIWAGTFFVVAGVLAVAATRRTKKAAGGDRRKPGSTVSSLIAVMVVSIFAILVALGMLAVASIGLHLTSNFQYETQYPLSWKVLESLLVVIALVEGLVAFLTSVMACKSIALNCRVPQQIGPGTESTALYMLVPKNVAGIESADIPQSLEMRPLVGADGLAIEGGFCATLERRMVGVSPSDPPHSAYSMSRPSSIHRHGNILLDGEDFDSPPPAYSERV